MHPIFVVLGYQTADNLLQAISISVFFLLFVKKKNQVKYKFAVLTPILIS